MFIFNEVMTLNMIASSMIVIGAGGFTLWRESRLGRKQAQVDPPGSL